MPRPHLHAGGDPGGYPKGVKISDARMAAIATLLKPDTSRGERDYTVKPATPQRF